MVITDRQLIHNDHESLEQSTMIYIYIIASHATGTGMYGTPWIISIYCLHFVQGSCQASCASACSIVWKFLEGHACRQWCVCVGGGGGGIYGVFRWYG